MRTLTKPTRDSAWKMGADFFTYTFAYAAVLAGLFSVAFALIALFHITFGVYRCADEIYLSFRGGIVAEAAHSTPAIKAVRPDSLKPNAGVIHILEGLEILLLSPLPYLLLHSLSTFIGIWAEAKTATLPHEAHPRLNEAKILIYGCFVGVLSLDFIQAVVGRSIDFDRGLLELLGLLLMILFFFGLKMSTVLEKH